ncbi:MAG: hypothetical protein Q8P12_01110, partial [bacterium]|nr:hypothetical protein [bacterium]
MDQFFSSFESMRRPEGQQAVPHGPATAPLQTEAVGAPANVPAITPVPQPRSKTMREIWAGQESQAKLGEFQGQTDIQTRAGEERKRLESERLQREGEAMGLKGRDLAEYKAGRNIFGGMQGRFVSKALGSTLPQNALGLDGVVIPAELRTQEHIFSGVPVGVNDAGDPQYQWVETVPGQGESPSTDIKNYQFAVSQGYKGTFEQWQKDEATRRPRSESTVVIETVDADGNPVRRVVPKTAGAEYPAALTGPTKTMREAAPKVVGFIKRIRPQLDSAKLGPVAGRWNELWTGKIGTADPEFMRLRTNVGLLSTLLLRMHVGARGGQILLEHFKNLMDSGKQSPENMRAALD